MKLLTQIPVNGCVFSRKVVNDKSSVSGILFFYMRDVKPNMRSILTFIRKTVDQKSINNRIVIRSKALYKCECGNIKEMVIDSVRSGKSKSCGCLSSRASVGDMNKTHGLRSHPLYYIYANIKSRCYNIKNRAYKNYGGRGIVMCDEWLRDFTVFYNWAISNGWAKGAHIDKDIKGGMSYSPDHCVIVTPKKNCNNRRVCIYIEYDGESKTVSEWCEILNTDRALVYNRIRNGWNPLVALTKPISKKNGH
jgi:hypothetical protein